MRRLLLVIPAVLAFLTTLLVLAPATWLDLALRRGTDDALLLADAKGSVWRGSGVVQAILPSGRVETLEPVRWTIDPWQLPTARLHISMVSERDGKPVLDATLSPSGIGIAELRLEAPAELLGVMSSTLRAAGTTGRLSLRASGVRVDDRESSGKGNLYWSDAGSTLTKVHPLGSYMVDIRAAGRGLDFTLTTQNGALHLTGGGKWQPDAPLSFMAMAIPMPDKAKQLAPLLRIIGKETGGDRYEIMLGGNTGLSGR